MRKREGHFGEKANLNCQWKMECLQLSFFVEKYNRILNKDYRFEPILDFILRNG